MPTFNIDTDRTVMIATGKVAPVFEWVEGAARGTERPVKRDPDSGFPLWLVDCLVDDDSSRSTVAGVEVPSLDTPAVQKLHPVTFPGLAVSAYVNRQSGSLVCRWTADSYSQPSAVRSASSSSAA